MRDHKIMDDIVFPFAGYIAIAGEAVRQMTEIDSAFRIRHIVVSTALVLPEGKPVEIVTSLRRQRLTDSSDSEWWEFLISSHNGHIWIKHCSGEVTTQQTSADDPYEVSALPRIVDAQRWFDTLKQAGLDLGPAFRNMGGVSTGTSVFQGRAQLYSERLPDTSEFHIHPTIVDGALQLIGMVSAMGLSRTYQSRLPVSCEELIVCRSASDITVSVETELLATSIYGKGFGVSNGKSVLKFSDMKFDPVNNSTELNDTHGAARLEWRPSVTSSDFERLVNRSTDLPIYSSSLKELYSLCVLRSHRLLAGMTSERPHLESYLAWIQREAKSLDSSSLANLDEQAIVSQSKILISDLEGTPAAAAAIALQQICENTTRIFSDKATSWKTLLSEDTIRDLQEFVHYADMSPFVKTLAHYTPNLRILEIGSWRDSPSNEILNSLTMPDGRPIYSKYTFTTKGFAAAPATDAALPNLEHKTLDISEDPLIQGFEAKFYDLIVANNFVSSTPRIGESLTHFAKLLRPSGHLLLQELSPHAKWVDYIFGSHQGWWSGSLNRGAGESCCGVERWKNELANAGFEKPETVVLDASASLQTDFIMVANPRRTTPRLKQVRILCHDQASDPGPILPALESRGFQVEICTLGDNSHPGQDVICLLDEDQPFLDGINADSFESFRAFIGLLNDSGLFWITRPSQMRVWDLRYAHVIGLARTIRSEMSIDFATCEVDNVDASISQLCDVFKQFHGRDAEEALDPDFEHSIHEGVVHVGRLYPFSLTDELLTSDPSDKVVLDMKTPGRLQSLHWQRTPNAKELQPYEVEIQMCSVGLNFRV